MEKRRALLEEKRRLLVWKLQTAESRVQAGIASKQELIEPQIAVSQMDAELARDQAGRLAALRRIVALRRDQEQAAEVQYRASATDRTPLIEAQIVRVNAELTLEEATRRKS